MFRIIPRLDIKNNFIIKGINFEGLKKIGTINEILPKIFKSNPDEIILLDCLSSLYERKDLFIHIKKYLDKVFVPLIGGGGIKNLTDGDRFFNNGFDKILINTGCIKNSNLLKKISKKYGSQSICLNIEAKKINNATWEPLFNYGRERSYYEIYDYMNKAIDYGCGEICITSVDNEGELKGLDWDLINYLDGKFPVNLLIGGGLKDKNEVLKVAKDTSFSGVTFSSLIYDNFQIIDQMKKHLLSNGINVRTK